MSPAFFGRCAGSALAASCRETPSKSEVDFVDLDEEETTLFGGGKEVYRAPQGADDLPF
jgi:hypothetical protein